jgi:alpha-N-arabinofuranosidase
LPPDRPEPITCAGHADFVELPNGQWWAVFLACRPYEQNWYNTGRETFLLPVHWENDWPVILKDEQIIPRIAARPDLPPEPESKSPLHGSFSWTDRFDQSQLNLRWQFLRPPALEWFSLMDTPGSLLIAPQSVALSDYGNPSLIACRQQHAKFSASTTVIVNPTTTPCEAGLVAFQNETHYLFLGIRMNGTGADEAFVEQLDAHAARGKPAPAARTLSRVPLPQRAARIILKIASTGRFYSAYCGVNDGSLKSLCENVDGSFLSTNVAGGFQGVMLGMFARK